VQEHPNCLELHAYSKATKHMGGLGSVRELLKLCPRDQGTYVAEMDCGVFVSD
jgi:hypothetical protein